ncbi:hypothetical protein Dsin_013685 [Dipteronia sinensis]|uniref:Reverse transcriptase n=1 Tax=Dipteronia sinensis TaxID=43782 RepID=A0AAE0EAT9_9ROSI|nr:hypothetical protein Dsin_013685 [Dipteronia sinensis]
MHGLMAEIQRRTERLGKWNAGNRRGLWKGGRRRIGKFLKIVGDYSAKIFRSREPNSLDMKRVLSCVRPCLSSSKSSFLYSKFTAEEDPTRAPGLDGLPALFYQNFWTIVGERVTKACLGVVNDGHWLEDVNGTLITLIPKVNCAAKIMEFRPISLCNVTYRIMAKELANRFGTVLDKVISETKSTFIPGQYISDNAVISFECIHALRRRKKCRKGTMALKLDMMRRLGFLNSWIDCIMRCVRTIKQILDWYASASVRSSKALVQDLYRLSARFWWGSEDTGSKIH